MQNLQQLKERFEAELRQLGQSVPQLQLAARKFEESREAVQSLKESQPGRRRRPLISGEGGRDQEANAASSARIMSTNVPERAASTRRVILWS